MQRDSPGVSVAAKDSAVIRGVVKYPYGIISGATVAVGEKSSATNKAGEYEIRTLTPGVYNITVQAPFSGYELSPQKVTLAAGETKTVDIYFDFPKAVVEGHVYDEDGKAIAGATLSGVSSGKGTRTTTTDEHGYFGFDSNARRPFCPR